MRFRNNGFVLSGVAALPTEEPLFCTGVSSLETGVAVDCAAALLPFTLAGDAELVAGEEVVTRLFVVPATGAGDELAELALATFESLVLRTSDCLFVAALRSLALAPARASLSLDLNSRLDPGEFGGKGPPTPALFPTRVDLELDATVEGAWVP